MSLAVLQHFSLTPAALLGQGSESRVYALDQERVLRVYGRDASLSYLQARAAFYRDLAERQPPFVIPQVLDQGVIADLPYTIERRLPGGDLARLLPQLRGAEREQALRSYLAVAAQIGSLTFPDQPFGEILLPDGLQCESWSQFLWERAQQTLRESADDLRQDVPQLDQLLARFQQALAQLPPLKRRALVHGDYFPGNVFIDNTLTVYGVGDFGYSTLIGDPRMDVAGAIIFLEVVQGYQKADTHLLLAELSHLVESVPLAIIELYRLYYALYFSHCKQSDPTTYTWCLSSLRVIAGS